MAGGIPLGGGIMIEVVIHHPDGTETPYEPPRTAAGTEPLPPAPGPLPYERSRDEADR